MNSTPLHLRLFQAVAGLSCLICITACNLTQPISHTPMKPEAGIKFEEIGSAVEQQQIQPNESLHTTQQYPVQQTAAFEEATPASESSVLETTRTADPSSPALPSQKPYYPGLQPQAVSMQQPAPQVVPPQYVNYGYVGGRPGCPNCGPQGGCLHCRPQTYTYQSQFPPCWPEDEYLFDGGDREISAQIDAKFGVHGLDTEDTIGHYDTLDGRREVTPSNRVCIYAPRFAAVRKVYGLNQNEGKNLINGMHADLRLQSQDLTRIASNMNQPLELDQNVGTKNPSIFRERLMGVGLENKVMLNQFEEKFEPYENFALIRMGKYDIAEKGMLAKSIQNALAWNENASVQVVIEGQTAYEAGHETQALEALQYQMPPGKPRLRVVKAASKKDALPGEIVEFTIRFDNVGDQRIGNVTIIDNLTPRLELIEDSAQCDIDAEFFTQTNEFGSLVLRWEIKDPLDVSKGGIVRFKAQVR